MRTFFCWNASCQSLQIFIFLLGILLTTDFITKEHGRVCIYCDSFTVYDLSTWPTCNTILFKPQWYFSFQESDRLKGKNTEKSQTRWGAILACGRKLRSIYFPWEFQNKAFSFPEKITQFVFGLVRFLV